MATIGNNNINAKLVGQLFLLQFAISQFSPSLINILLISEPAGASWGHGRRQVQPRATIRQGTISRIPGLFSAFFLRF